MIKNIKIMLLLFLLILPFASYAAHKNKSDSSHANESISTTVSARPWWLGDLLTVLSILIGAAIIVFQLNRQHNNNIEAQKENYREKLRLEIYQEFSLFLGKTNKKTIDASMYAFLIPTNMANYIQQINAGLNPPPIKNRGDEFSKLHFASNNAITNLIILMEKYEIVSPELYIFKTALNAAMYNITESFSPLFSFLLTILPMDIIDSSGNPKIANIITPSQKQIDELNRLVNIYRDGNDELGGYLFDLNVELQKVFLSNLFANKVKNRNPIDPEIKVISTDPAEIENLRKYFDEESPWGKNNKEIEENVRKNINGKTGSESNNY